MIEYLQAENQELREQFGNKRIRWTDAQGKIVRLTARSPNLNSYAERWVRSLREECLSRVIPQLLLPRCSMIRLDRIFAHYELPNSGICRGS